MGFYATVKMNELIYQCERSLKQSRRKKKQESKLMLLCMKYALNGLKD